MALTSSSTLDDAKAQFKNSLRYWESAALAGDLAEAIHYLLLENPESVTIGEKSYTRESLEALAEKAVNFAQSSTTSRPAMFSRARVTGVGR